MGGLIDLDAMETTRANRKMGKIKFGMGKFNKLEMGKLKQSKLGKLMWLLSRISYIEIISLSKGCFKRPDHPSLSQTLIC